MTRNRTVNGLGLERDPLSSKPTGKKFVYIQTAVLPVLPNSFTFFQSSKNGMQCIADITRCLEDMNFIFK